MCEFLEDWEKQVQKSTRMGAVEEREVVVPYSVKDTFFGCDGFYFYC